MFAEALPSYYAIDLFISLRYLLYAPLLAAMLPFDMMRMFFSDFYFSPDF